MIKHKINEYANKMCFHFIGDHIFHAVYSQKMQKTYNDCFLPNQSVGPCITILCHQTFLSFIGQKCLFHNLLDRKAFSFIYCKEVNLQLLYGTQSTPKKYCISKVQRILSKCMVHHFILSLSCMHRRNWCLLVGIYCNMDFIYLETHTWKIYLE